MSLLGVVVSAHEELGNPVLPTGAISQRLGTRHDLPEHASKDEARRVAQRDTERVRDELIRILESDTPLQALYMAQKMGILGYIIPELETAVGVAQNQAHSFDVFEHLLRSLQACSGRWLLRPSGTAMSTAVATSQRRHPAPRKFFLAAP